MKEISVADFNISMYYKHTNWGVSHDHACRIPFEPAMVTQTQAEAIYRRTVEFVEKQLNEVNSGKE